MVDIWYLIDEIKIKTGFKYILDIIDHFSKWYNGYLLKTKEAYELLKKIEIYIENFGKCKILQVDNGIEFKNKIISCIHIVKIIIYLLYTLLLIIPKVMG